MKNKSISLSPYLPILLVFLSLNSFASSSGRGNNYQRCYDTQIVPQAEIVIKVDKKIKFVSTSRLGPAVSKDGTLIFGSKKNVLFLNSKGGKKAEYKTDGEVTSSPVITNDGMVVIGSEDHKVYFLNPNGTKKAEFDTGGEVTATAAIAKDGTIVVPSNNGKVFFFNKDGTKKAEFDASKLDTFREGLDNSTSPAIAKDGTVVVGLLSKIYFLNTDGAQTKEPFTGETKGSFHASPATLKNGSVVVSSNFNTYFLNSDGKVKASHKGIGGTSSPTIGQDGTVIIATHEGSVVFFNPEGEKYATSETGDYFQATPAVTSDGTTVFASCDKVYYFNLNNGSFKRGKFTTSPVSKGLQQCGSSPIALSDGRIFVGMSDGYHYFLSSSTKKLPAKKIVTEITCLESDNNSNVTNSSSRGPKPVEIKEKMENGTSVQER